MTEADAINELSEPEKKALADIHAGIAQAKVRADALQGCEVFADALDDTTYQDYQRALSEQLKMESVYRRALNCGADRYSQRVGFVRLNFTPEDGSTR